MLIPKNFKHFTCKKLLEANKDHYSNNGVPLRVGLSAKSFVTEFLVFSEVLDITKGYHFHP